MAWREYGERRQRGPPMFSVAFGILDESASLLSAASMLATLSYTCVAQYV